MASKKRGYKWVVISLLLCTVIGIEICALSNELESKNSLPGQNSIDRLKPGRISDVRALQENTAYDDASPGDHTPALAYDSQNNRYLLVYRRIRGDGFVDIVGRILSHEGTPSGSEFAVSSNPDVVAYDLAVAYDSVNHRFLVVWDDYRNIYPDVYGQLVDVNGMVFGDNFLISNATFSQGRPSVAYDPTNQRFLVVWTDGRKAITNKADIYGQLLNADGTLFGTTSDVNLVISNAHNDQQSPSVAYDSVNQRFLVVWEDLRSGRNWNIYGQLVNTNGTLFGTASDANFVVSDATGSRWVPSAAYDPASQRYLVVWEEGRNDRHTMGDIYGQLVNAEGTLFETTSDVNLAICNATRFQGWPSVAYDSVSQRFLAIWQDKRDSGYGIYGQFIGSDGTLLDKPSDANFFIHESTGSDGYASPVAFNPVLQNFLVPYQMYTGTEYGIGTALVGSFGRWVVNPSEGTIGTILEVPGVSLGTTNGKVALKSGWMTYNLKVLEWNEGGSGVIKAQMTKAIPGGGMYDLVVFPKGHLPFAGSGAFAVEKPEITELSASGGKIGTKVKITGKLFGYKKGKVLLEDKLTHGRKSCKVLSWPATPGAGTGTGQIQFAVPKVVSATYRVIVQNKVGEDAYDGFEVTP